MKNIPLLNYLSVRILCAVFVLMLISGVLLYQLVIRVVVDAADSQSYAELSTISQELRSIAERYREQSLQSRRAQTAEDIDTAKWNALRDIERAMTRHKVQGALFEQGVERLVDPAPLLPAFRKAAGLPSGGTVHAALNARTYFLLNQHFSPWAWEIILLRDAEASSAIRTQISMIYLVTGGILIGNLLLIFLFIRSAINYPMESIIQAIERGQKPSYRGIHEFEALSTTLARVFDEKNRLVNQLLQDQIMENLRVTTRGVVHNFNNILVGALGYASLGKMKLQSAIQQQLPLTDKAFEDIIKYIESIEQAAERASELARKLSNIAQTRNIGAADFQLIDINVMLRDIEQIIRTILPRESELALELSNALPLVHADSMQLEQALLNLCINSRDAMREAGTLTVVSRRVIFEKSEVVHPLQHAGAYVAIDIRDTGEGMDEDTQARIFEPFFTTKPMDQGTGLGLTMVDMIMQSHSGFVLCESTPGLGTTFSLYIPAEKP
jgi:signal transduction histidine kinase